MKLGWLVSWVGSLAIASAALLIHRHGLLAQPQPPPELPTLNSPQLDQQIRRYWQYVAASGAPDFLIVGSSRALQGVDPIVLENTLAAQGHANRRVFNFSVNGSTAQVVNFKLQQLLPPAALPRILIWADGARAFNSGRVDRTYQKILTSPGYQQLQAGEPLARKAQTNAISIAEPLLTQGFQAVTEQFKATTYYRRHPYVAGRYDGDYSNFTLAGEQNLALQAVLQKTRAARIPVIFVSLPLNQVYLDRTRTRYEWQFRAQKQRLANRGLLTFYDLTQQWSRQDNYFADPSHLNQQGASAVSQALGRRLALYLSRLQGQGN
jgi:lysophospholipase L1-like esterase